MERKSERKVREEVGFRTSTSSFFGPNGSAQTVRWLG